jgi:hypothetical protein
MAEPRLIPPSRHADFSASAAHRWSACAGSWVVGKDYKNSSSQPSADGTSMHFVSAECWGTGTDPREYIGDRFTTDGMTTTITRDMAEEVIDVYLSNLREYQAAGDAQVQIEVEVNYSKSLGLKPTEGWGTVDALFLYPNEIGVHDLKTGRGEVVDAEDNVQLSLYAIGAIEEYADVLGYDDDTKVTLVIHQPRYRKAPSEWATTVGALREKAAQIKLAAHSVKAAIWAFAGWKNDGRSAAGWAEFEDKYLVAGEKQCRWCPAKGPCSKVRNVAAKTVFNATPASPDEFTEIKFKPRDHVKVTDNDWLAAAMAQAPLIESWLKAVRAEVDSRLLAGQTIKGFKVVMGSAGDRKWADEEQAEAALKAMRLKQEQMYNSKLISPTMAEKLTKGDSPPIGERQWKKLQDLIQRAEGKPHVAPESDARQAIQVTPVEDEFDDLTQQIADDIG